MNINVNDLDGIELDRAVAECDATEVVQHNGCLRFPDSQFVYDSSPIYSPSTNWEQGGAIIEQEGITIRKARGVWHAMCGEDAAAVTETVDWSKYTINGAQRVGVYSYQILRRQQRFSGPTPLVAAMRCYVASKPGNEVYEESYK
jgi:hypothetical protein